MIITIFLSWFTWLDFVIVSVYSFFELFCSTLDLSHAVVFWFSVLSFVLFFVFFFLILSCSLHEFKLCCTWPFPA